MKNYLAGGTNSPIPIPKNYPIDIIKGKGPFVIDNNNKKYIDMWMGYGALLFGHSDPEIAKLLKDGIDKGWFFSYATKIERELSLLLHDIIPSAERVRFATTGGDAVAYAIRAAKAYTNRSEVLTVLGGYHGVHERMIESKGVSGTTPDKIEFNNLNAAIEALKSKRYACLILEPILANSGCTPPQQGYLKRLKSECTKYGTILIFDEVVTGFRISLGGAQQKFGVTPDMSLFSKAIAGGLPLSVIAGRKKILEQFIPTGKVFYAGTFNGHPLSMLVATNIVKRLKDGKVYKEINALGKNMRSFINEEIKSNGLNACVQGIGSMFTVAFGCKDFPSGIINTNYEARMYKKFIELMAQQGVLFPPLPTETVFLSQVHKSVLNEVKSSIRLVFRKLKYYDKKGL